MRPGSPGRAAGGGDLPRDPIAALLEAARRARCRDAEVQLKTVVVRQVAVEPPLRIVSRHSERGTALRLIDAEGREGFAWRADGDGSGRDAAGLSGAAADPDAGAEALLREALESARVGGRPGADWPADPAPGAPVEGLVDAEALRRPDDALAALAATAVAAIAKRSEGALEIDRVVVSEAATSVRLARLSGAGVAYDRTLAAITVAVAPAVPEADAVVEERSACRLDDLDPADAARAAVARALPRRPAAIPAAIDVAAAPAGGGGERPAVAVPASLVLAPRAAATLWAALAPLLEAGAIAAARPSALDVVADGRAPGRPSSAPCDGAGRPSERRLLMRSGCPVARVDATSGPFTRPSYRDRPAPGVAALVIEPGRAKTPSADSTGDFALCVEALEVRPGPTSWSIEIRRGDWRRLDRTDRAEETAGETGSLGAADGIVWEGPPAEIVQAVAATLDDVAWFEVGLPVATPSAVLDGLGPWRLPEPAD
jgi:predicted Zn-dependent protease